MIKKIILKLCFLVSLINITYAADLSRSNDIVSDMATSLQWQDNSDTSDSDKQKSWSYAITYCEDLSLGGYNDWRLPNINELLSLLDLSKYNPAIKENVFNNVVSSRYWSSTSYASGTSLAWAVNFSTGVVSSYFKSRSYAVRCVRGG